MERDSVSVVDENEVSCDGLMGRKMRGNDEMELQVRHMSALGMGMEIRLSDHAKPEEVEKRQQICALVLLCYIVHSSHLLRKMSRFTRSEASVESSEIEQNVQLMAQLAETEKCRDIIRMSPQAFLQLCEKLRSHGHVTSISVGATVEGQVAEFLYIVGHDGKTKKMPSLFHQSRERFYHRFDNVLACIGFLFDELIRQPSSDVDVAPKMLNDNKFYPYFKDCIGVLGVTHCLVKVPMKDGTRLCGWKDFPIQTIFAACNFDLKFNFFLIGEGDMSYSRVLREAFTCAEPLKIPEGKFYLGHAGYVPKPGVLTPYTGVRNDLKEYSTEGPQNFKELFNHCHYFLQNVTERTFRVLKKRFPILVGDNEPLFPIEDNWAIRIIMACLVLHNFLMDIDIDKQILAEVDHELLCDKGRSVTGKRKRNEDYGGLRKNIALEMWNAYEV